MNLKTAPEMLKVSSCLCISCEGGSIFVADFTVTCLMLTSISLFTSVYDKHDNPLTSEEEEQRAIAKIKMLGNIKFIGELGKLDLIHESILHKCIKTVRALFSWCFACLKFISIFNSLTFRRMYKKSWNQTKYCIPS